MVDKRSLVSDGALASIEAGALLNAARYGGRAEVGAVVGRVLAEFPELRHSAGEVTKMVRSAVERINRLSFSEQETLLKEKYPDAEKSAEKEGRVGLPPLPNAVKGETAFRIPPEPSGFMTIGHAMAFTINYIYAETYDGELWLRFEDTNPKKVALRYYESFRQGIKWLGIRLDHEKNISDDMDLIYGYGRRLIQEDKAYSCSCDQEKVKQLRFDGKACVHRDAPIERSLAVWEKMLAKKVGEGESVIRFKGDMQNLNYSLRDPNLFRVIQKAHPITGERYILWPTYYLANSIEDEVCGITHVLRSSEFSSELQRQIREALGFRALDVIQFSRFNFKGTPVHKRLLRPLVEEKLVSGWDDPRMPTIEGLKRRGVIPEAIREFTLQVGYTKSEHEYDWSLLLSVNRKLLDPRSKRIFFVPDPVELSVEGAPKRKVAIPFHPEMELGERDIATSDRFFVPRSDLMAMKKGTTFRLMDLYNVELTSAGAKPKARYAGEELVREMKKLQWVNSESVEVKVLEPGLLFNEEGVFNKDSLGEAKGLAEAAFASLKTGEIVQFPRFGFCRVDSARTCILT
ncbi:MAG: glutamate--tRNA ligase [Nitrososphaerales archaeon]|jgi:glutamyl-tRNA synthetase